MSDLEQKLQDHDHRLRLMEDQSLKNTEQMAALLGELHDLSGSLRETVLTFREYAVKHDNLTESNKALWNKYEKQNEHMDQKQLNLDSVENNKQEYVSIIMAHAIGWRYKTIDGHVYRRQYDYSAQIWLGEWERC